MDENNVNVSEPMNGGVPAKVSGWSKVKRFLTQDVVVEMTPYQEKVFQEVHDFWHQEITWQSFKDFWMQEIEITL